MLKLSKVGKRKKASLSLSINAIVILVLAITMLGLGLGFTKGMFGKLAAKLSVPEPDIPATADDPIVLPVDTLMPAKNKDFIFSVNVYNDNFGDEDVSGELKCPVKGLLIPSALQDIPTGEDKGFKFIIPKVDLTAPFTEVCTLTFTGSGAYEAVSISKQVVIMVK